MIQDVPEPLTLFPDAAPAAGDWVFAVKRQQAALAPWREGMSVAVPLVQIGARRLFLGPLPGETFAPLQQLRSLTDAALRFGALSALHLARWLLANRFCGSCGGLTERRGGALVCTACAREIFPAIAPAVILGVICRGKLLVTRYADRPYKGPALVAGYCEAGETVEETCRREAFEETGLRIRSLRYFASQPWGLSGALLLGFFAETDDPEVTLADGELAEAVWLAPHELPPPPDAAGPLSLTATMIAAFAEQNL